MTDNMKRRAGDWKQPVCTFMHTVEKFTEAESAVLRRVGKKLGLIWVSNPILSVTRTGWFFATGRSRNNTGPIEEAIKLELKRTAPNLLRLWEKP